MKLNKDDLVIVEGARAMFAADSARLAIANAVHSAARGPIVFTREISAALKALEEARAALLAFQQQALDVMPFKPERTAA